MSASDPAIRAILHDHVDGVHRIGLNRPKAKNAVSFDLWEQFSDALDLLERGTPVRALVIHGLGGFFCAGGDIKTAPARGDGALANAARLEMAQRVTARLRALPSLTIAAVEGGAIGIGWGLALSCDMIISAENAQFRAPFVDLGLVPDGGVSWYLVKRLGRQRAADILFSGRKVSANEAFELGLVSRLSPAGQALDTAVAFADGMGRDNLHALEMTKRLLDRAEDCDLGTIHLLEAAFCHVSQTRPDAGLIGVGP